MLYQQEGKRLLSVYPKDLPTLDGLLAAKLCLFGYNVGINARKQSQRDGEQDINVPEQESL